MHECMNEWRAEDASLGGKSPWTTCSVAEENERMNEGMNEWRNDLLNKWMNE